METGDRKTNRYNQLITIIWYRSIDDRQIATQNLSLITIDSHINAGQTSRKLPVRSAPLGTKLVTQFRPSLLNERICPVAHVLELPTYPPLPLRVTCLEKRLY